MKATPPPTPPPTHTIVPPHQDEGVGATHGALLSLQEALLRGRRTHRVSDAAMAALPPLPPFMCSDVLNATSSGLLDRQTSDVMISTCSTSSNSHGSPLGSTARYSSEEAWTSGSSSTPVFHRTNTAPFLPRVRDAKAPSSYVHSNNNNNNNNNSSITSSSNTLSLTVDRPAPRLASLTGKRPSLLPLGYNTAQRLSLMSADGDGATTTINNNNNNTIAGASGSTRTIPDQLTCTNLFQDVPEQAQSTSSSTATTMSHTNHAGGACTPPRQVVPPPPPPMNEVEELHLPPESVAEVVEELRQPRSPPRSPPHHDDVRELTPRQRIRLLHLLSTPVTLANNHNNHCPRHQTNNNNNNNSNNNNTPTTAVSSSTQSCSTSPSTATDVLWPSPHIFMAPFGPRNRSATSLCSRCPSMCRSRSCCSIGQSASCCPATCDAPYGWSRCPSFCDGSELSMSAGQRHPHAPSHAMAWLASFDSFSHIEEMLAREGDALGESSASSTNYAEQLSHVRRKRAAALMEMQEHGLAVFGGCRTSPSISYAVAKRLSTYSHGGAGDDGQLHPHTRGRSPTMVKMMTNAAEEGGGRACVGPQENPLSPVQLTDAEDGVQHCLHHHHHHHHHCHHHSTHEMDAASRRRTPSLMINRQRSSLSGGELVLDGAMNSSSPIFDAQAGGETSSMPRRSITYSLVSSGAHSDGSSFLWVGDGI